MARKWIYFFAIMFQKIHQTSRVIVFFLVQKTFQKLTKITVFELLHGPFDGLSDECQKSCKINAKRVPNRHQMNVNNIWAPVSQWQKREQATASCSPKKNMPSTDMRKCMITCLFYRSRCWFAQALDAKIVRNNRKVNTNCIQEICSPVHQW